MTLTGVLISLVVGCLFVLVWGLVSHIVASHASSGASSWAGSPTSCFS
jgi:phosphotransferase system  glucose/maltose/N-acetylglucosamine-specific IIC component